MAFLGCLQCCLLRCSLLHCKGQQKSHFQKSFDCQLLFLSHAGFPPSDLFPFITTVSLKHFHTCICLTPPVTRSPLLTPCFLCPFLRFLSLKHFVRLSPSPVSLTALYRSLCILQQYCHAPPLELLASSCSKRRSCDNFL